MIVSLAVVSSCSYPPFCLCGIFRASSQSASCGGPTALRARGSSATARAGCVEWVRPVECPGSDPDAGRIWLSDRPVRDCAFAISRRPSGALGAVHGKRRRAHTFLTGPGGFGRPSPLSEFCWVAWRLVSLSFRSFRDGSTGIDAYTAICRALGILPGSPAQRQPFDATPPAPVSQVAWTPEVLQILADANPERGRAKVMEVCASCHGDNGVSPSPNFPHLAGQSGDRHLQATARLSHQQPHA